MSKFFTPRNVFLFFFTIYGAYQVIYGEYLPLDNGFAWDAASYRNIAVDFPSQVFGKQLNSYTLQRFVPSAIVYCISKLTHLTGENEIFLLFSFMNLFYLLISILILNLICKKLNFSSSSLWLVFTGMFINYAFLRQSFYYPVHTDTLTFLLTLLVFYFYLENKINLLFLLSLIAVFTWPSFLLGLFPFFLFPLRNRKTEFDNKTIKPQAVYILTGTTAAASLLIILYLYYKSHYYQKMFTGVAPVDHSLIFVSIISIIVYLTLALFYALRSFPEFNLKFLLKQVNIKGLLLWSMLVILLLVFIKVYSSGAVSQESPRSFIGSFFMLSVNEPLINLVSHAVYFGPIFILCILFYKDLSNKISEFGIALQMFLIIAVLFSIGSESRRLINLFPVIFITIALLFNEIRLKKFQLVLFGIICFIFSKIWFNINTGEFPVDITKFQQFPWQNYFMNIGPWMSKEMYLLQGGLVLVSGVLLFLFFKKGNHPELNIKQGD